MMELIGSILMMAIFVGMFIWLPLYWIALILKFFVCILPGRKDCVNDRCPLRTECGRKIMSENEWARHLHDLRVIEAWIRIEKQKKRREEGEAPERLEEKDGK